MIERLSPQDVGDVYHFIKRGAKEGLLERPFKEIEELRENFFVYRLEESGILVGCASLEVYSPRLAEIRSVFVHKDARGFGIGTQLIQRCVDEAKAKGVREIIAITDKIPLFEKAGFNNPLDNQRAMFLNLTK